MSLIKPWLAIGAIAAVMLPQTLATAEEIQVEFPWGCESPENKLRQTPYQVLPKRNSEATEPIHVLKPKQSYSYGWFGSNPQPIWGRHFGHSRNYTQWTRR